MAIALGNDFTGQHLEINAQMRKEEKCRMPQLFKNNMFMCLNPSSISTDVSVSSRGA